MERVPLAGDEKTSLWTALRRHRAVVHWKCEGLDDEQLRRVMTPSGLCLLGLVKHLGGVEYEWFTETYGLTPEPYPFSADDPGSDFRVEPSETTEDILGFYRRACAASDAVVAPRDLADTGTAWFGETVSLRRVLVGMVEETARHAGHMDILRELVDGATGDHDRR